MKNEQALAKTEGELLNQAFSREQVELIKSTIAVGATDDELKLFLYTAQRSGLDPLAKQIHFVKRAGKMTIQTAIDGYRLIADRTGKYAGNDDPIFNDEEAPKRAMVTVYKIVDGQRCPFTATARWSQYFPGEAQGFMWKKMPHLMLGKCAEGLALRKAFPAELSGLYTTEEMEQANVVKEVTETPEVATDEQKIEINDLAQQLGMTASDVTKRCQEKYGVSFTKVTKLQADGIIGSLKQKVAKLGN
jgi:phage recombination protein Bet